MDRVFTPDGWGQILRTQSARGVTSYLVKGAGFEGWYDGLQVTADFLGGADGAGAAIDHENETTLPYPSRPQGPGWDGTNSTIQPNIDPHLERGQSSDSLTGETTGEDPVEADIEGLFEPHSRLAGARVHRLHFAASDDKILDVSALPEESPTGLEHSPINPDGVDTDDLFSDSPLVNLEHQAAVHDRLVIEDNLAFLRFASDEDKKDDKKDKGQDSYVGESDSDDDDDDSSDGEDSGDGDGGSSHTAAFALTTTADLHFLANLCACAGALPLHSKSEHRELRAEADTTNGVTPQPRDLAEFEERYTDPQLGFQEPLDLVDHSLDDADASKGYNHYASVKTAAPAQEAAAPTQIESQIEQLMQFWAVDNNGWWHWTGSQADLALLNQMQQQMMMVGAPGGPPGQQMQAQSAAEPGESTTEYGVMSFPEMTVTPHPNRASAGLFIAKSSKSKDRLTPVLVYRKTPDSEWLSVWNHRSPKSASFVIEANTPEPWKKYLQVIASDRMVALAAWKDVVQKSKRLRTEGAITLEVFKPDVITAYVQGDNGKYYTTVQRLGSVPGVGRQLTSAQVSGWSCECDWGHWAWIRKRSFVGRMCSHAYALFSEMRSLDFKRRRGDGKGKPLGTVSSVVNKASWTRASHGGFEWVSNDPTAPTAMITKDASGWGAQVWSDGTADDSLDLGAFKHSEQARRAISRTITAHVKLAEEGDVDMVGGSFKPFESPDSISGGYADDPYTEDGAPEPVLPEQREEGSPGVQDGTTRFGSLSVFAEKDDGQDDEGPEETDDGIEEEDDPDDEESLDEEIADDEGDDSDDGQSDEGEDPEDTTDDGGHDEPHRDEEEGTDNPGDDSDDDGIEKHSSVAELQQQFGLTHLAGANYSLAQQDRLVREGDGKTARNLGDLNLTGTHYEAAAGETSEAAEDVLAFLF